ncbi:MAG: hypothetical protein RI978_1099, partial [Verrucomicrobiota bacterium]
MSDADRKAMDQTPSAAANCGPSPRADISAKV